MGKVVVICPYKYGIPVHDQTILTKYLSDSSIGELWSQEKFFSSRIFVLDSSKALHIFFGYGIF